MRYEFIEVITADPEIADGYWAVVEGKDGTPTIIDNCFDTPEEAEREGRAYREDVLRDSAQQEREAAFQAGMGMGCAGYNDFMGYA